MAFNGSIWFSIPSRLSILITNYTRENAIGMQTVSYSSNAYCGCYILVQTMPLPVADASYISRRHPLFIRLSFLSTTLALLSTAHHRRLRRLTLLQLLPLGRRTQRRLLPQIHAHHILHTASVMLDSPHVCQPRSSRPLSRALHNFNTLHQWTVDLIPHLDAHTCQLATKQDCCVDAAPPDVDTHACKWVAGSLTDEQDVSHTSAFWVIFGEETGSSAAWVEESGLGGGHSSDGVGAGFLDVKGCGLEDGYAEAMAWNMLALL